jgi:transcriptional regulator with XRE-family HTH domain
MAVTVNDVGNASRFELSGGGVQAVSQTTKLLQWRLDAGLSLAEESDLTGYSTAMLSRAERGQRVFSPMARVKIARRLGVAVSDLFEVEDTDADPAAVTL